MEQQIQELKTEYTLTGCISGCIHRQPDTIETEIRQPERGEKYILSITVPHCDIIEKCAARRQEIYNRAESEKIALYNKLIPNKSAFKKSSRLWRKIANEYTEHPCPFFEN